ncbi:MAG: PAS domain S-box protein [Candidatus Omnitrophica bacterium]|nr:PAS domain S-box protein [Candidatus Omnitrophota bacterium]MDD5552948.1 PAS domain S-box protein [Candidatus Omnitrophota bacterium]
MEAPRNLLKENEELKNRLKEAEELLAAIKSGSVDAFVTDEQKVFTLKGADYAYRILIDTMIEGAATLALDMTVTYCNRSLVKMFGKPSEKIVGYSFLGLFLPENRDKVKSLLRKGVNQEEFLLKKNRKTPLPVLISSSPLKLENAGYCLVLTDLSEIKKAQEELQKSHDELERKVFERTRELSQSEKKFRLAFENSQDAILWADVKTGILVAANNAAVALFEMQKDKLIGSHFSALHPREAIAKAKEAFQMQALGKEPLEEVPIITRTGKIKTAQISSSVVHLEKMTIIQGVFRDITRQKELDGMIKEIADKYSTLFDTTSDGILIHDLKGEILEVNDAYCRMSGYSRKELTHMPMSKLETIETGRQIFRHIKRVADSKHERFESRHRRKDGSVYDVDITCLYLEREGGLIAMFMRDITDRKKSERDIFEARQRLQTLMEATPVGISFTDDATCQSIKGNAAFLSQFEAGPRDNISASAPDENAKGRKVRYFIDGREIAGQQLPLQRAIKENRVIPPVELEILLPSGKRWFSMVSAAPINDAQGRVLSGVAVTIDVTERKKSEKALEDAERKYRELVKYAPAGIYEIDLRKKRFISVNDAMLQMLGFSREELVGLDPLSILDPESQEHFQKRIKQWLKGEEPDKLVEYKMRAKDGHYLDAALEVSFTTNGSSKPLSATIVCHDVTEQKKAEKKLKQLNRTLKAMSDSNQAMMRAEDELKYLEEICKIIVQDCGHFMVWVGFIGTDEAKAVRPVAQAGFEENYLKTVNIALETERGLGPTGMAIRSRRPYICKNILTDPNFAPWREEALKRGYASSIALPLISANKVLGAINIYSREADPFSEQEVQLLSELSDDMAYGITAIRLRIEHAKAEDALAASRDLLQSIIDNTPHLIYILDLERRFLIANKAVAETVGVRPEELIGKRREEVMPPEFARNHDANDQQVIKKRSPMQFEEQADFKGRTTTFLSSKFPLFDSRKRIYAVAGISSDITDRKKAEDSLKEDKELFEKMVQERTRELFEAQIELERAKRLSDIGVLAATVAHELRNPLAAISMAAHNIKRKAKNPELESHLVNIDKKIAESDQIINNLLFYSRLKPPHYEKVDIFNLLEESIAAMEEKRKKDVPVMRNFETLKGVFIEADPLQIKEVFNNILNNAYDAVPQEKGQITVTSEDETDLVNISFKDNGEGIREELLEKVFDPFFTTKAKGVGLGLSVCRQIINFHNGYIRIESGPGKGTNVIVKLPKKKDV